MADVVAMPKLGFDMAEGTLVRWVVPEGKSVSKGVVLAEIETDKATVEVESAYEGIVLHHLVKEGDVVPVNTPIAIVGEIGETIDLMALGIAEKHELSPIKTVGEEEPIPQPASLEAITTTIDETSRFLPEGVRVSPLARRMARERGLDLKKVKGSGPGGRIVKADIEHFQEPAPRISAIGPPPMDMSGIIQESFQGEVVPLSRLRSVIGRRMTEAKQQVPHFYITHEYDVAALLDLRKQINTLLPEEEKISINDFVIKAVALTLRSFPNLNASLKDNQIARHASINLGVAVAVENGLLTVVCRDTDQKPLRQIAMEVRNLVNRARDGKVSPEDIEGSTFSVSNLGMFDVEHFIAIINPPEAAILAVGSAREVPVVVNHEVKPGYRMKATISVDHRVSDGVEAARFLQSLAFYIEEPLRILIG